MDHRTSLPASIRRARGIVLVGVTLLGALLVASAPMRVVLRILAVPLDRPGWQVWLGTINGVALMTVIAAPFAAAMVWVLVRRRAAAGVSSAWRTSLAEVGIVYGTVPWVWLTMQPGAGAGTVPARVSLVPLRDLITMDAGQIIGNLLVFAALGLLAPVRFATLASLPRVLVLGMACSVLVESAQFVLRLDRVSSVDDVLLNTAGAGLAALVSSPWWWRQPGSPRMR